MSTRYIEENQAVVRKIVDGKEHVEIINRADNNYMIPTKGCIGEMGSDDVLRCKGKCKHGKCHKVTDEQNGVIVEWCECDAPPPPPV